MTIAAEKKPRYLRLSDEMSGRRCIFITSGAKRCTAGSKTVCVPGDVSVVGFDNTDICEFSRPRLTTVEVPLREIGQLGAEMLLDQIENGVHEPQHITLPTRLRARDSAAPPQAKSSTRFRQKKEKVS